MRETLYGRIDFKKQIAEFKKKKASIKEREELKIEADLEEKARELGYHYGRLEESPEVHQSLHDTRTYFRKELDREIFKSTIEFVEFKTRILGGQNPLNGAKFYFIHKALKKIFKYEVVNVVFNQIHNKFWMIMEEER